MNDDKYLICQKGYGENKGKWEFPGGKVHLGESYDCCIKRELLEELELKVNPKGILTSYVYKQFNLIFIECDCLNPDEVINSEHSMFYWSKKEELNGFPFIDGDFLFVKMLTVDSKGMDSHDNKDTIKLD